MASVSQKDPGKGNYRHRVFLAARVGLLSVFLPAPLNEELGVGSEKADDGLGLHLLPSSSPRNSWKTPSNPIQTGSLRVRNNDGEYEGKWSPARSKGQWDPPARVPAQAAPTSHRSPALQHAHSSTHCFRIPPLSLSPRISAPHPTAPNRLPRLLRWGSPHTRPGSPSLSRLGGAQRHWD